jgi:hypothetical protein
LKFKVLPFGPKFCYIKNNTRTVEKESFVAILARNCNESDFFF